MKPLLLFFACLILFSACSGDSSVGSGNGRLKLFLTDQPLDAKEVWVTISNIEVHKTGGAWIQFDASTEEVDLLTIQNREQLLQSAPLEEGKYTGIRLAVTEGHIIDADDQRCELKVPSDKVQVPLNFDIETGNDTEVVLDFDAEKSVHVVKTGNNEQCILRPVILVKSESEQS